jgi:tetratricopeptide (TPR) repeat protein
MEIINRAIELYPEHAAGYALRAGMELNRRQFEHAEADYTKAITLEPENATYRLARAHLYTQMKRKKQAREDVREAARLGATAEEVAGAAGIQPK